MLELIISSFVIFGNTNLWAPNSLKWLAPSTPPGDEQLYEPLLKTIEKKKTESLASLPQMGEWSDQGSHPNGGCDLSLIRR